MRKGFLFSSHDIQRYCERGRGRRRWWIRPVNRQREQQGFYHNLISETQLADHEEFFDNLRMWPEQFEFLHTITSYVHCLKGRQL